jgi:hypothetical protein
MAAMEGEGAEEANVLYGGKAHQSSQAGRTKAEGDVHGYCHEGTYAVSHDLYQNDQFCGFVGSSGPSQVTKFGSVLG